MEDMTKALGSRLQLAAGLSVEKEGGQKLVVINRSTGARLQISRAVYDLMHRFRNPEYTDRILGPVSTSLAPILGKLIEAGFLYDPDSPSRGNLMSEKALARVSPTLFRVPARSSGDCPTDVVVIGIPYDSGNIVGPGARGGPDSIRAASCEQEYECDFITGRPKGWFDLDSMCRILEGVTISDWGNIRFMYGQSPDQIFERVESVLDTVLDMLGFPLSLGGDHSVTFPIVKAIQERQPINLIWLDAHTDQGWLPGGQCHHHGNVLTRILELPNVGQIVIIGHRGFTINTPQTNEQSKPIVVTPSALRRGRLSSILTALSDRPCYISIDVDVLDPVYAPGTSTPVPDGLTPEEVKSILVSAGGICQIVGLDVVEVNPLRDQNLITAMRVCNLIMAGLHSAFMGNRRGGLGRR